MLPHAAQKSEMGSSQCPIRRDKCFTCEAKKNVALTSTVQAY